MSGVSEKLRALERRIEKVCERVGRDKESITLIAVTKTVNVQKIRESLKAGVVHIGENYVQEAKAKYDELKNEKIIWHFIGHLQSNKAKQAVKIFDWIQTVDRMSLARKLDKYAQSERDKPLPVLIQVNVGDESTKSGVSPEEVLELYKQIRSFDGIVVRGLMTIPPYFEDSEDVRPYFRKLANLLEELKEKSSTPELLTELSMGMSHDFEIAIEEGATMVRIGTAIFGPRPFK